jgi:hypothetical protein
MLFQERQGLLVAVLFAKKLQSVQILPSKNKEINCTGCAGGPFCLAEASYGFLQYIVTCIIRPSAEGVCPSSKLEEAL